jgi:hypothetical protein
MTVGRQSLWSATTMIRVRPRGASGAAGYGIRGLSIATVISAEYSYQVRPRASAASTGPVTMNVV